MKHPFLSRVLSFLFAAAVLMTALMPALADSVDLSAMSDDEVSALLDQVNQEVVTRGIQKTAKLSKGTYLAGKDIPAGSYVYTCLATGSDWGNVTIYSEGGSGSQLLWEVVSAPDDGEEAETFYFTLNDGDQLKSGVPFSLTVFSGVLFQ